MLGLEKKYKEIYHLVYVHVPTSSHHMKIARTYSAAALRETEASSTSPLDLKSLKLVIFIAEAHSCMPTI